MAASAATSRDGVREIIEAINNVCREKGGEYAEYSCKTVSWDDVQRSEISGNLSCWGANITDTRLYAKDGTQLFTVRPENWNEKLGHISADGIAFVEGNQMPEEAELESITLEEFLANCGVYGGYAGLQCESLGDVDLDQKVSIRFQTTFLPVMDEEFGAIEFAPEMYNYNTSDDEDPRNLILLCSSQGIALQQDGCGIKKIYHHDVDRAGAINRFWLEAERTKHKVGGAQDETEREKHEAKSRGKATSSFIGIKAMGKRFNVLLTVQIPLEQQKKTPQRDACASMYQNTAIHFMALKYGAVGDSLYSLFSEDSPYYSEGAPPGDVRGRSCQGEANAARVSRGTKVDTWTGLGNPSPQRNKKEHVTVTCVIYNTIAGGVPSEDDVLAAVKDMESLYEACNQSGRLDSNKFNFMKG